jgi:ABC-type multidrug transport system ATPase subunit
MTSDNVLMSIEGISVNRGLNRVLDKLDFKLFQGEIVALNGENGCGKSTLIEASCGLLLLREGRVLHQSKKGLRTLVSCDGKRQQLRPFGLCLQENSTTGEETVLEHLSTACELSSKVVLAEDLLAILDIWQLKHRANDRVGMLSGGMQRKVSVIAALLPAMVADEPTIVFLDEPDDGLDIQSKQTLLIQMKSITAIGHSIIISTHDESILEHADRSIQWRTKEVSSEGETPLSDFTCRALLSSIDSNLSSVYRKWIFSQENRTKSTILNGVMASVLTILTLIALNPPGIEGIDGWRMWTGMILLPCFIIALIPGPERILERGAVGHWWAAHSAGKYPNSVVIHIPILGMISTILAVLMIPHTILLVLISGFLCWLVARVNLYLWVVHRWLHRPRQGTQLLLVMMVFPWLLIVDGMSLIATEGSGTESTLILAGGFGLLVAINAILQLLRRA